MSEKKYELLPDYEGDLKGGQEARRYPDGSIRNERGFMLEPLPGASPITTSERGKELAIRRAEIAREQSVRGIREGVGLSPNGKDAMEIRLLNKHATEVFMESNNSRGLAELFGKLLANAGYNTEPKAQAEATSTPSILVNIGPEALERLISRVRGDVIDADIEE